jgi:hypothetical protein
MLILGMALALTNFLVDAGIPDACRGLGAGRAAQQVRLPAGAVPLPVRRRRR